jgi:hypothetical protein
MKKGLLHTHCDAVRLEKDPPLHATDLLQITLIINLLSPTFITGPDLLPPVRTTLRLYPLVSLWRRGWLHRHFDPSRLFGLNLDTNS